MLLVNLHSLSLWVSLRETDCFGSKKIEKGLFVLPHREIIYPFITMKHYPMNWCQSTVYELLWNQCVANGSIVSSMLIQPMRKYRRAFEGFAKTVWHEIALYCKSLKTQHRKRPSMNDTMVARQFLEGTSEGDNFWLVVVGDVCVTLKLVVWKEKIHLKTDSNLNVGGQ